jgi:hypothetical protein
VKAQPTEIQYTPLPTDDFLTFKIPFVRIGGEDNGKPGVKEQKNFFDETKMDANVEFDITTPGYETRKMWSNFGMYWPTEGSAKTTKLYDLAKAIDPEGAIKGKEYDLDRLMGREGRMLVEDYVTKKGNPSQKIKTIFGTAKGEVAAEPEPAAKAKRIRI